MARNERLLRRTPPQPMREATRARATAMVDRMSSGRLPTRTTSEWSKASNQVQRRKMRPASA